MSSNNVQAKWELELVQTGCNEGEEVEPLFGRKPGNGEKDEFSSCGIWAEERLSECGGRFAGVEEGCVYSPTQDS